MRARDLWRLKSPLWLLPPLALGVAVLVQGVRSRGSVEPGEPADAARTVSVRVLEPTDVTPEVTAYGTARAARRWTAVPRVAGEVVEIHPDLDSGAVVEEGATLLRIERVDVELGLERARAELASVEAQLDELERSRENDRALREVEREALAAADRELERLRGLVATGTASESAVDTARRVALTQQASLTAVEGRLELFPARRAALEASGRAARARVRAAELDLERTELVAPFRGRLVDADLRVGQYVALGEALFALEGTDQIEVDTRLHDRDLAELGGLEALQQTVARVSLASDAAATFEGSVVRLRERVDPHSRTLGLVVRVEREVDDEALLPGAFCEVVLRGRTLSDRLVVPRSVVRDGSLLVVDGDDRIQRRQVEIELRTGDRLVLASGVEPGDRVILIHAVGLPSGARVRPVSGGSEPAESDR